MQQQKTKSSFKDLYVFVRHCFEAFSKDTQRHVQGIQKSCDDLRLIGASEERVAIFEDILQDMAEAVRNWPQYSSVNDKKIATGLLALNVLLLPLIYSWGKPNTTSQIVALCVVIINLVFNLCYLAIRHSQENLNIKSAGCLLSLVQIIFSVGTILLIIALLWYVFPPAVIVFLLASIVAFFVWVLYMVQGTIIAAHIRRVPPPQGNVQDTTTLSAPSKENPPSLS